MQTFTATFTVQVPTHARLEIIAPNVETALAAARAAYDGEAPPESAGYVLTSPFGLFDHAREDWSSAHSTRLASVIDETGAAVAADIPLEPASLCSDSLRAFVDVSTAHVRPDTMRLISSGNLPTAALIGPHGAMVYCAEDRADLPRDLARVLKWARAHGACYVCLDQDAPVRPDLPSHMDAWDMAEAAQ